jgi:hypothetical protein
MAYEQAQIAVQNAESFALLRSAIERAFAPDTVEKFYRAMQAKGIRVREFEKIANAGLLEEVDPALAGSGKRAQALYEALALSDQALMREFYLEKIEKVDASIRLKYQKIYRYY